jgi:hypothetical protein
LEDGQRNVGTNGVWLVQQGRVGVEEIALIDNALKGEFGSVVACMRREN